MLGIVLSLLLIPYVLAQEKIQEEKQLLPGELVVGDEPISMPPVSAGDIPVPILNIPKHEGEIDLPHLPPEIPSGAVEVQSYIYNIPQPVIHIPKPIIQKKLVVYNVPQPILQFHHPVLRKRPVIYEVPYLIKLPKAVVQRHVLPIDAITDTRSRFATYLSVSESKTTKS